MGKTKGPYQAEFEVGTSVQIASRNFLKIFLQINLLEHEKMRGHPVKATDEELLRDIKLHHLLETEQLDYHDRVAVVQEVSFYHGAAELYRLEGIPGIWHEQCLKAAAPVL